MENPDFVQIPQIRVERQQRWENLKNKYVTAEVIKNGGLRLMEVFYFLAHIANRSAIVHALANYLTQNRAQYATSPGYDFHLLKEALLGGSFGLRESLADLVNCTFGLGIPLTLGSSRRIFREATQKKLAVAKCLEEVVSNDSAFARYLEEFRHPYIHREDISRFSVQDMAAALGGFEQPRIVAFIERSGVASHQLQIVEAEIADECCKQLGIP